MNPTLQQLKNLGIKQLQITNNEAIAFSPHINLPPLPTSGIPDGTVPIEQVREQWQAKDKTNSSSEWFDVEKKQFDLLNNMEKLNLGVSETRIALVLKQVKEEEPKQYRGQLLGHISYDFKNQIETFTPYEPASVEPEGEQTAEGIEPTLEKYKLHYITTGGGTDLGMGYLQEDVEKAMNEYAASQLAQYKAKLISKLEGMKQAKSNRIVADFEDFDSRTIDQLIDLIQTR